jgi:hypothetical protein
MPELRQYKLNLASTETLVQTQEHGRFKSMRVNFDQVHTIIFTPILLLMPGVTRYDNFALGQAISPCLPTPDRWPCLFFIFQTN